MNRPFFCAAWLALLTLLLAGCGPDPSKASHAADAFFSHISHGEISQAYESSTFTFQTAQTLKSFEKAARELGLASNTASWVWNKQDFTDSEARFAGEATTDGGKLPLSVTLAWERGEWRILTLRTGPERNAPTLQNTPRPRFTLVGKDARLEAAVENDLPSPEVLQKLVEDNLVLFNDAVQRKSFSDFYNQVSARWRENLTEGQLRRAFQSFVDGQVNLGTLRSMTPVFDKPPEINSEGVLILEGHYPPAPYKVCFALRFVYELPRWKLFGLNVELRDGK